MIPNRIQLRRTKGWRKPAGAIVCARPGPYGNPIKIATTEEIRAAGYWGFLLPRNVDQVLSLFETTVRGWIDSGRLSIDDLRGHDLCCWCRLCRRHRNGKPLDVECPDCAPCHVDVYGRLLYGTGNR